MDDVSLLISIINPKYSSQPNTIKKLLKEKGFSETYRIAEEKNIKPNPPVEHKLVYDSAVQTLEPIYFWILDFMNDMFGGDVEKLIDNFTSSPGSGHFSELQGKASQMQQEASRVLGTVNNILKGIINLIYDLKEWQIILSHYDQANSKDKQKAEAGILALKQRWLDKVDIQRGQGSIHAMTTGQLNFVTLRDAFMAVKSLNDVDKLDLNERVKRILKPRFQEFLEWKKRSEQELKKRYEIEKSYLKSQVEALKLNTKWAKPYLKAAAKLTMNEKLEKNPEFINIFNTVLLELSIMGKRAVNVEQEAVNNPRGLPENFKNIAKKLRKYYAIVLVDFNFRGIPSKVGQHYAFGGRADVSFKAYALNEDELKLLHKKLDSSDIDDSLKLIQGMTDESLAQIKADLDEFLEDKHKEHKEEIKSDDTNPFSALFSFLIKPKKEKPKSADAEKQKLEELEKKGIRKDKYAEQYVRSIAESNAVNNCYNVFDIYKKAHGMASLPYMQEKEPTPPETQAERLFRIHKF